MDDGDFQVLQPRAAQVEPVSAFTQRQPCRARNKPVNDIGLDTATVERDGLVTCLGRHRNNIASENVAGDLQILVRVSIIQRGRTGILQRFNYQREADLVTVIDNGHHVLRVVFAQHKWLRIAFGRERECECSSNLRVVRHDRSRGIPINIRAENRNLPCCQHLEVLHLAGLHIALCKYINDCGRLVDFDVAGRLHNLV